MSGFDTSEESFELEPRFFGSSGEVFEEGDEVYVRGTGGNFLGIGTFAGQLVLKDSSGSVVPIPIFEVQETLLSGRQVDLWSSDSTLIEANRYESTYPIGIYLAELGEFDSVMRNLHATALGVPLD